ncbi:hypothetical protein [Sporosarcina sp. FSL W7-1283]|uniref:hypothetical protein n=1 Tax=Sporosarcina sp. FSL W7-1283 TaxID=2921560 RepID=UPI0030F7AE85
MFNRSHLNTLKIKLSNEMIYLKKAKSINEKVLRIIRIDEIEKEIEREKKLLGIKEVKIKTTENKSLFKLFD